MSKRSFISGTVQVEVTTAAAEETLNILLREKVQMREVFQKNELTYLFTIRRNDLDRLEAQVSRLGGRIAIRGRKGLYWKLEQLHHRSILVCLMILLVSAALFIPSRILFVRVEGNAALPVKQIISAAEDCGIRFGASRRHVRSEKVKNELLSQLPQLQWAGVNTIGCTAVISVRERSEEPQTSRKTFSNLIATQDGYILSQVVLNGTPIFSPGKSVKKGQILISGYSDCGICIRTGRAEGDVLAQTRRDLIAISPKEAVTVQEITDRKYKISLLIRKKRINLWKSSRISYACCGRMYKEYFFSLPGGFQLPIAICVDQYLEYDAQRTSTSEDTALLKLQQFSDRYLLKQTVAGQILKKQQHLLENDGFYTLKSRYICTEMIGKEQEEQNGEIDEQGN